MSEFNEGFNQEVEKVFSEAPAEPVVLEEHERNINRLKHKHLLYKDLYSTFKVFFILQVVLSSIQVVVSLFPKATTYFNFLETIILIAFIVFFFIYLSKGSKIARAFNNKTLKTAFNFQFASIIGAFVWAFACIIIFTIYFVSSVVAYGDSAASVLSERFVDMLIYRKLMNFSAAFVVICIVLVILIIALFVISIIGTYKEFGGHMIEAAELDSSVVDDFAIARKWYLTVLILNFVISILRSIINIASTSSIIPMILSVILCVLHIVPLFLRLKALNNTVFSLEAKISE